MKKMESSCYFIKLVCRTFPWTSRGGTRTTPQIAQTFQFQAVKDKQVKIPGVDKKLEIIDLVHYRNEKIKIIDIFVWKFKPDYNG
jgi:hypothetical protein